MPINPGDSGQDIIRGSSDIPLSPQGLQEAHEIGMKLAMKGGLDSIATSDLRRASDTAKIIAHHTHAPIVYNGPDLHPWHLGEMEGQPTEKVMDGIINHMEDHPDEAPKGRGPESTSDGESFNDFKRRGLTTFKTGLARLTMDPTKKDAYVTHYRMIKLAQAWQKEGGVGNDRIDKEYMKTSGDEPGSVHRMYNDPRTQETKIQKVDLNDPSPLLGGMYLIRHGATAYNKENQR